MWLFGRKPEPKTRKPAELNISVRRRGGGGNDEDCEELTSITTSSNGYVNNSAINPPVVDNNNGPSTSTGRRGMSLGFGSLNTSWFGGGGGGSSGGVRNGDSRFGRLNKTETDLGRETEDDDDTSDSESQSTRSSISGVTVERYGSRQDRYSYNSRREREPLDQLTWSAVTSPGFTTRIVQQANSSEQKKSPLKSMLGGTGPIASRTTFNNSPNGNLRLGQLPVSAAPRRSTASVLTFPSPPRRGLGSLYSLNRLSRFHRRDRDGHGTIFVKMAPVDLKGGSLPVVPMTDTSSSSGGYSEGGGEGGRSGQSPKKNGPPITSGPPPPPNAVVGLGGTPGLTRKLGRMWPNNKMGASPPPAPIGYAGVPPPNAHILEVLRNRKRGRGDLELSFQNGMDPHLLAPRPGPGPSTSTPIVSPEDQKKFIKRGKYVPESDSRLNPNRPLSFDQGLGLGGEPMTSKSILEQMNQTEKRFLPDTTPVTSAPKRTKVIVPSGRGGSSANISSLRKRKGVEGGISIVEEEEEETVEDRPSTNSTKIGKFCHCNECYAEAAGVSSVSVSTMSPQRTRPQFPYEIREMSVSKTGESSKLNSSTSTSDKATETERTNSMKPEVLFGRDAPPTRITKEQYDYDKKHRVERFKRLLGLDTKAAQDGLTFVPYLTLTQPTPTAATPQQDYDVMDGAEGLRPTVSSIPIPVQPTMSTVISPIKLDTNITKTEAPSLPVVPPAINFLASPIKSTSEGGNQSTTGAAPASTTSQFQFGLGQTQVPNFASTPLPVQPSTAISPVKPEPDAKTETSSQAVVPPASNFLATPTKSGFGGVEQKTVDATPAAPSFQFGQPQSQSGFNVSQAATTTTSVTTTTSAPTSLFQFGSPITAAPKADVAVIQITVGSQQPTAAVTGAPTASPFQLAQPQSQGAGGGFSFPQTATTKSAETVTTSSAPSLFQFGQPSSQLAAPTPTTLQSSTIFSPIKPDATAAKTETIKFPVVPSINFLASPTKSTGQTEQPTNVPSTNPPPFQFGQSQSGFGSFSQAAQMKPAVTSTFTSPSAPSFQFGQPQSQPQSAFSVTQPQATQPAVTTSSAASSLFQFGTSQPQAQNANAPAASPFQFNQQQQPTQNAFNMSQTSSSMTAANAPPPFQFGQPPAQTTNPPASSTPFQFGQQQNQPQNVNPPAPSPFGFPQSQTQTTNPPASSPFQFQAQSVNPPAASPFQFAGQPQQQAQTTNPPAGSPFQFGTQPQPQAQSGFSFSQAATAQQAPGGAFQFASVPQMSPSGAFNFAGQPQQQQQQGPGNPFGAPAPPNMFNVGQASNQRRRAPRRYR